MATWSLLGTPSFDTNSGTHTVTATPAVGDLVVLVTQSSGSVSQARPTDNNPDGLGGHYVMMTWAYKNSSADFLTIWVRNSLIGSASSTVFTHAPGTTTGGGLAVLKLTSMSRFGMGARRSHTAADNQAAGTPSVPFGGTSSTAPIIGALHNETNPSTMSPIATPSAFTERLDTGFATPTTGINIQTIDSGHSNSSLYWGSASASIMGYCGIQFNELAGDGVVQVKHTAMGADSTTQTVNMPSGLTVGNKLLVIGCWDGNPTITKPAEFTLIEERTANAPIMGAWERIIDGTEAATYDWTSSAAEKAVFMVFEIPASLSAIESHFTESRTTGDTSPSSAGVTTVAANALVFWIAGSSDVMVDTEDDTKMPVGGTMYARSTAGTLASSAGLCVGHELQASPGAMGSKVWGNYGGAGNCCGMSIVFISAQPSKVLRGPLVGPLGGRIV